MGTMLQKGLEVAEILEQLQDVLAASDLRLQLVLVEGADVLVELLYAGLQAGHLPFLN